MSIKLLRTMSETCTESLTYGAQKDRRIRKIFKTPFTNPTGCGK